MPKSRLALLGALVALLGLALAPSALASKRAASSSAGLTQTYEYVWNNPNPAAPTWCLNEDDWHVRTWTGSLNGSFAATERLCDESVDYSGGQWWNAGGIGLQVDLFAAGTLNDVAITSPLGDSHHGVLVGSTTSKGTTINHYQVCYVPPYMLASDTGYNPLPGGTWQLGFSGQVTNVNYTTTVRMADVSFQQSNCPASEQNLH